MAKSGPAPRSLPRGIHADAAVLTELFHRRWAVPVLARLHDFHGARFVALQRPLAAPRESMRATLEYLLNAGLVERNPGYGHPARPEYILTTAGRASGAAASALMAWLRKRELDRVCGAKWPLPVLVTVAAGHRRFGELEVSLPDVSPRALALGLKSLEECRLLDRRVTAGRPPGTRYAVSRAAKPLVGLASALAKSAGPVLHRTFPAPWPGHRTAHATVTGR